MLDRLVVDHQFQRLITGFGEFDNRASAQSHHFRKGELTIGQFDNDRHMQAQNTGELAILGGGGICRTRGLKNSHLK